MPLRVVSMAELRLEVLLQPARTGETVTGWTVYVRALGSTELIEIASGSGPNVTAELDPTVLANGLYGVVIESTASNGGLVRTVASPVEGLYSTEVVGKEETEGGRPHDLSTDAEGSAARAAAHRKVDGIADVGMAGERDGDGHDLALVGRREDADLAIRFGRGFD